MTSNEEYAAYVRAKITEGEERAEKAEAERDEWRRRSDNNFEGRQESREYLTAAITGAEKEEAALEQGAPVLEILATNATMKAALRLAKKAMDYGANGGILDDEPDFWEALEVARDAANEALKS